MIKAIFFDIDGTLLSHKTNQVPASTFKALTMLKDKGIYTFAATGRHITEIQELTQLNDLPLTGWITLNGQYCYNDEGVYDALPFDPSVINTILTMLDEEPFPCMFVSAKEMIINYHDDWVKHAQKAIHTSLPPLGDLKAMAEEPIYQIIPYVSEDKSQSILAQIHDVKATRWHEYGLDFLPATGGKDYGIQRTCDYYHVDLSETMAFGDGDNDISMLDIVGIGVAMGNSAPQLIEHADYITDDIDHDGLYKALEHFHII